MGKAKKPGYRQTVYISTDLKQRMDKAPSEVNWSAVASEAFELKLAELMATKKGQVSMSSLIERLRVSKKSCDSEVYNNGFKAGKEWATNRAEYAELVRLEEFRSEQIDRHYWYDWFEPDGNSAFSPGETLAEVLLGEDTDRHGMHGWWTDNVFVDDIIDKIGNGSFVCGFCEGALEVFDSVKDQI